MSSPLEGTMPLSENALLVEKCEQLLDEGMSTAGYLRLLDEIGVLNRESVHSCMKPEFEEGAPPFEQGQEHARLQENASTLRLTRIHGLIAHALEKLQTQNEQQILMTLPTDDVLRTRPRLTA